MRCDLFLLGKTGLRRVIVLVLAMMTLGGPAFAASQGEAITATRFSITIDGYEIASFSELQGISSSVDVPVAGAPVARAAVVLKRGLNRAMELWSWHEAARIGDLRSSRKSATLVAYGADGKPVARYYLENAWPSKIEVGSLRAGASEVLMETVTMTCEFIQRVSP